MAERAAGPRRGTALVTGASSGIGRSLAEIFAAEGWDLVLTARDAGALRALGADLERRHGARATILPADLADPDSPRLLAARASETGLAIDALVNNAGFGSYGAFAATALERELAMLRVNIVALTHLTKLLLPAMLERRRGYVLNVASTAAFQPGPFMAVYYASKAYVLHWSEALAEEVRGSGVVVTALCPGPTRTNFQTGAKMETARLVRGSLMMEPEPVARAGYAGLLRGRRVVIPGARNRFMARAVRLLPRSLVPRLVRRFQEPPAR
jgi:short-subunit dehydrogenase